MSYCQKIYDDAKRENLELLPCPTYEQRANLGIGYDKTYYNKLLELSDKKQVMGCQIVSAHLMRQLTSIFCVNTKLDQRWVKDGKVSDAHISVLVPCTDGKLYVLNVYYDKNIGRYYSTIDELLTYANTEMAYAWNTKCYSSDESHDSVGLYIRVLLNQIINNYEIHFPDMINSLTGTVNKIDQEGDFQLQPYIYSDCLNCDEFKCKPEAEYQDGDSFVGCCLCLISDDDKISKYDMNVWNSAVNIGRVIRKKEHWENFLKLAEVFPKSKVLIACPNAFHPKIGDPVVKLDIKGRKAIKNLGPNGDGKIFQKVLSLKKFLDIESKHDSKLQGLLQTEKYKTVYSKL